MKPKELSTIPPNVVRPPLGTEDRNALTDERMISIRRTDDQKREKDVTHAEIQLRVLECFSDLRPTPLNTSNISTRLVRNDTRLPTTPIQISTSLFHKKRYFFF